MNTQSNSEALPPTTGSPFVVPPFDGKKKRDDHRFTWWSWHPRYPYWSKSCWGGETEEEANQARFAEYDRLELYHNKLIQENDDHTYSDVVDSPCKRLDAWCRIAQIDGENAQENPTAEAP